METAEQRRKRIMGKQFLPRYIDSLNKIMLNEISQDDLLSIVETDFFYSQIDYSKKAEFRKTILFSDRKNVEEILMEHFIDFNEKYILWIEYANDCGALKLETLNYFNFEFPYNVSKNGIITLTRIDYKYKILLDFYDEDDIQYIDIEIFHSLL